MKRILTFALVIVLLLSLTLPAAAAGKIKATTMRLELIEGSAGIQNSSGVAQSYNAGMRLYSGYTVTTAKDSCAYISLDDTKAVKLDMLTTVRLKQSGKKLQLQLVTGQIFANTTVPLTASETLEIRTSTMVTGIRGTMVTISVEGDKTTVYLTETTGKGASITNYAKSGENVTLKPGQRYTCENGASEVVGFQASELPSFTQAEILKNAALRSLIENQGILDISGITEESVQEKKQAEAEERGLSDNGRADAEEPEEEPYEPYVPSDEPEEPSFAVTLPSGGDFYSVTRVSTDADGGCRFTVQALPGYEASTFRVSANGAELKAADGVYAVENLTENVTVTVQAEKVATEYVIFYELNGGTQPEAGNPESYTVGSGDITLLAPERKGYAFVGWTGTNLSEPAASVTIPSGSTGDRNYTAVWAEALPDAPVISWEFSGDAGLCLLETAPEDGLLPEDAVFEASGSVVIGSGEDFIFTVLTPEDYGYALVYANGSLLEPAESTEVGGYYLISGITENLTISLQKGVSLYVERLEELGLEIDSSDTVREEYDDFIQMIVPIGSPVSFSLSDGADSVLTYLNGELLTPVDGVYSFVVKEETEVYFTPCIRVTDGSLETLQSVLADAEEELKTVLIDCNINVPEGGKFSNYAPVVLAEGRKLTLAVTGYIFADFTNNGTVEVLDAATLYIGEYNEGGPNPDDVSFRNYGTIIVNAHASLSNYGALDNMESGVITLCGDDAEVSPMPAKLHNEGSIQDFGTLNCGGEFNNIGVYRVWTDDIGIFQPYGSQLFMPGNTTSVHFTGNLTIESGVNLYLNSGELYICDGATLTVEDGGSVQIFVSVGSEPTCLVLDNGSELLLNGSIATNDLSGFRDNEGRWTLQEAPEGSDYAYQVAPPALAE